MGSLLYWVFGFLRAAEFTISGTEYDPGYHLSLGDIAIYSHEQPSVIHITRLAKHTHSTKGLIYSWVKLICPVTAIIHFWLSDGAPLFTFIDGRPLSHQALVSRVREALTKAVVDASPFSSHSFRIGAATAAAKRSMEDSLIQTLGRWKSAAYLQYIRLPRNKLASVSKSLISS